MVYNQINTNTVGNSFLSNVEYKLVNNNDFTLSLADSLINGTVGNKLSQLVYNQINTNTSATSVLSSLNSNLQKNTVFVDNVVDTMTTNSTFGNNLTDLIYNKINNTPTAGNTVISKLAYNLATNPDYQYILQGPPGDVLDPVSLQKSMIPKTLWCSNGTFGNIGNSTLCNIPNQPTFNTTSNTYTSNTSIIQVGDWQIYQSTDGNLQFVNKNNKIPNASIVTDKIIRSSKALLAGPESMTSNVLGGPNTTVIQPNTIFVDRIQGNQRKDTPLYIGDTDKPTTIRGGTLDIGDTTNQTIIRGGYRGGETNSHYGPGVIIPNLTTSAIYPISDNSVNIYRLNTGTFLRLRSPSDWGRSLDQNGGLIRGWENNNGPNQMWHIGRS